MKRAYIAGLTGLVFGVSCGSEEPPGPLNLSYEITDNGGAVKLSWNEVEGADYYLIRIDGDSVAGVTTTSYTVTTPGKTLSVIAVGVDSSGSLSFSMIRSPGVKVWSKRDMDTSHPRWVMFDTTGQASAVSSSQKENAAWVMNDDAADTARFYTNWTNEGGWNPSLSAWFALSADDLNGTRIAPAPGGYYSDFPHGSRLDDNLVGMFWLDQGTFGAVDGSDHFGKLLITDYNTADPTYPSATIDIYWQSEPKLRWLVY